MLYLFDVDGTLVRSFMREGGTRNFEHVCPRCGQEGTLKIRADTSEWHCEMCPWHGDEAAAVYGRVEVLPRRLARIERLAELPGSRFGIVTNQGGVAFGYQTEREAYDKLGRVIGALNCFYGRPLSVHVCFTHPSATLECWRQTDERRKPGPGMLLEAMERHRVDTSLTWFVGDMESDLLAASRAGVRYYDAEEEFFR